MIDVKDLTKSFGKHQVLQGINEHIEKGEKVAVIGPSDAGISRIQDIYRKMIYLKHPRRERLLEVRRREEASHGIQVQMDLL